MTTLSPKQQEIRDRESQILETARPMLVAEGYHGLNMDKVAESLKYSKGTIYNHFRCKEEIILALAIETLQQRWKLFQRAAAFRGSSRERISAIGFAAELFVRLFPDHFMVEQLIRSASLWEKTTEKRRSVMRLCEQRCMGLVSGIVLDGVASGDLALPPDLTPEDLVFGLWSQSFGVFSIITISDTTENLGIADPFMTLRRNANLLLDGYGWKKLSTEHDYQAVCERVKHEVFCDEHGPPAR